MLIRPQKSKRQAGAGLAGLRGRIAVAFLSVLLLLSAASITIVETVTKRALMQGHEAEALTIGRSFAATSLEAVLLDDALAVRRLMAGLMEMHPEIEYLFVTDDRGTVVAATLPDGVSRELLAVNEIPSGAEYALRRLDTEQGPILDVAVPLFEGNAGTARVGLSERSMATALNNARLSLLAAILTATALALGVSFGVGRAIARPLEELALTAGRIRDGELSVRSQVDDYAEVRVLATALNNMVGSLSEDIRRRQVIESELVKARDELELRVEERTEELAAANEALGESNEELAATNEELAATNEELAATNEELAATNEDLKSANIQLAESNRLLDEVTKSKSDLLAAMSHELRTPLNAVIGFSDLMLRGMAGPVTEEQSRQLEMVRASGSHLLLLINDMLDLARLERGHVEPQWRDVDVGAVAKQAFTATRQLGEHKGLEMRLEIHEEVPVVITDSMRLEQMLVNLLGNAIKFTDEGCVQLTVRPGDETAIVEVADTGIGIPEQDLDRVFDEFYRVRSEGEGSGLGLAICSHIADAIGARLEVSSTEGDGSTFRLTLPVPGGSPTAP